jgi:hypothetical protein
MTVGNQTTEKVNPKINGTAMMRMFNLRNIFELVNNALLSEMDGFLEIQTLNPLMSKRSPTPFLTKTQNWSFC